MSVVAADATVATLRVCCQRPDTRGARGATASPRTHVPLDTPAANGRHVEKSTSKTLDYLLRGCDGNNADSCHYGALLLLDRANVKHDPRRAVKMLDKACTKLTGGALSCAKLGSMKLMGDDSAGVKRDAHAAAGLLRTACVDARHAPSCRNLAVMYHKGDGVARDEAEARRLMDDAKQLMRQEGILKDRPAGPLVKGKRGS